MCDCNFIPTCMCTWFKFQNWMLFLKNKRERCTSSIISCGIHISPPTHPTLIPANIFAGIVIKVQVGPISNAHLYGHICWLVLLTSVTSTLFCTCMFRNVFPLPLFKSLKENKGKYCSYIVYQKAMLLKEKYDDPVWGMKIFIMVSVCDLTEL